MRAEERTNETSHDVPATCWVGSGQSRDSRKIWQYYRFVVVRLLLSPPHPNPSPIMAKSALAKDQFVKLIVGAGQASPSPPVGPALGSKGVKSMDFCKVGLRPASINQSTKPPY